MKKRKFIISYVFVFLLVSATITLWSGGGNNGNTITVTVNGGGSKGTKDFGALAPGETAELIVNTDCESITGSIDKGDDDGWRGGDDGAKKVEFVFDSTKVDTGSHPGKFSGKVNGCPGGGSGNGSGEKTWSVSANVRLIDVKLKAISAGNEPDLEKGKIAMNAQEKYDRSHWKFEFMPAQPDEYEAELSSSSENVLMGTEKAGKFKKTLTISEEDDKDFWVKSKDKASPGEYKIKSSINVIKPNKTTLTAQNSGTLFGFKLEPKNITCGPTTNKVYKTSSCQSNDPRSFEKSVNIDMPYLKRPKNGKVKQKVVWNYKVMTKPNGVFNGAVTMPTKIESTVGEGSEIYVAAGLTFPNAKTTFENKLSVEGLKAGNGFKTTTRVADTNHSKLEVEDTVNLSGLKTTFNNNEALYKVGKEVKVIDVIRVNIDRNSTGNRGSGDVANTGFSLDTGGFIIESKSND